MLAVRFPDVGVSDRAPPLPGGPLEARLGERVTDGVRLQVRGGSVRFVPVGARDVALTDGGMAHGLYRDVWPATDVVQQVEAGRVKEAIVLRSAEAPSRFAFLAQTTLTARVGADGAWQLVDSTGEARLIVERPFVVDARGRRVDLQWVVDGHRWSVVVPEGLAYPVVLDPTAGVPGWTNRSAIGTLPGARQGAAMAWDGTQLVLFGGASDEAGTTLLSTTAVWNVSTGWTASALGATPPARRNHAMVSLPGGGIALFGGVGADELSDFYVWTSAGGWSVRTVVNATATTPRQGHAMVALPSGVVVVHGGRDGAVIYGDTFEFGITATNATITPATNGTLSPDNHWGHSMFYDSSANRLVVFGGQETGGLSQDTWFATREAAGWGFTAQALGTSPPARREGTFVAYPSFNTTSHAVLFGGLGSGAALLNDAWLWNGSAWSNLTADGAPGAPPARSRHAAGFDNTRKRLIVTMGSNGTAPQTDTWELRINNRPDFNIPGPQTVAENSLLQFTVSAADILDADDTTTLSLVSITNNVGGGAPPSNPSLSTIFPNATATNGGTASRQLNWTPDFTDAGTYTFTFRAADGVEPTPPTATVQVTITNTNRPPTITLNPNDATVDGNENVPISFTATAADPDGDAITFTHDVSEAVGSNVTTVGNVKTFAWTPTFTQGSSAGSGTVYNVAFSVTDGTATANVPMTITVDNTPTIATTPAGPAFTVAELSPLSFTVQNGVLDGDLTISNPGGVPTGATFTGGTFSWTPSCAQARTAVYPVTFRGTDADGETVDITRDITVTGSVVSIFPSPHTFPSTPVGQTSAGQTFTISNGGTAAFNLNNVTTSNPVFTLSGLPTFPFTLGAGLTRDVTVAFAPSSAIVFTGNLIVTTNDGVCPTTTAALNGTGLNVSVTPGSHGFGEVRVTQAGTAQTITLTNNGVADITVNQPTLTGGPEFTLALPLPADPWPRSLAGGDSLVLTANGTPQSVGQKNGQIAITTSISATPIVVPLTVIGVAPGIALAPVAVDFGPVDIDTGVATQTVSVGNDGTFDLSVTQVRIVGPGAARYSLQSVPALPHLVVEGGAFDVVVGYDPTLESVGEAAAQLEVLSNAFGEPIISLPLSGRGADRHIALSEMTLAFPGTRRNTASELSVIVRNTGEAPLALSAFSFTGDGAAAYSTTQGATTVPPAGEVTVPVSFRPTAAATFSASLIVTNNDDGVPMARVDLSGVGVLPPLQVSPGALTANVVPVGVKRRLADKIVVTNPDDPAAEITLVCVGLAGTEECDPSSPFSIAGWAGAHPLAGRSDETFAIDFAPTAAGLYSGRVLVFVDGDPVPLLFVTIGGQGIDDVVLSGGGCDVGGGGGDWWIVLVGLALLTRRRALVLAALLVAATASADPATSFDLGVFRPTVPTRASFITVEPPEIHSPKVFGAGLTFDYAKNPLLARRAGMDEMDAPVSDRSELILGLTYALPRVQLTVEIPVLNQAGSVAFTGVDAADGTSLGDVSLHARFALWKNARVALAASAQVALPTGDAGAYAGSDGLVMKGLGIFGVRLGRLRLAANAGVRARTAAAQLGNIEQGSELVYGGAGAVRVLRGLDAIAEIFGSRQLGGGGQVSPLEALVGGRVWITEQVAFSGGGGMGLVSGVGAPDFRVFAGVAWFPTESSLRGGKKGVAFGGILDIDEDGLPDAADRCPSEAEDFDKFQDEDGCPEGDNDADGIADTADKCPNEPEDGDEFQDDDGCPEVDNDGDKVVDARDKCPTTLEDPDGFRDEDGCPDPDNDGDGLPDKIDQCPLEPEIVNANADDDGCPDAGDSLVMMLPDKLELLAPVEFVGESANLKPGSRAVLEQVATTLRLAPQLAKIRIASHVHRRGGAQADYALSQKRGDAVKKLLVDRGVEPTRLEVKPFGSTKPLGGRDLNDRIIFEIVK